MCTNEIKTKVQNIIKGDFLIIKTRVNILGLWVVSRHSDNQQRFPIHALADTNANTEKMVPRQGGEEITIFQYYWERYGKEIQ